jgi:hypothetical protein
MTVSEVSGGPRESIRVRAALAGGLVFGIATSLSVASWTDAEFVTSTFTASRFDLEVNVNGAGYSAATPISVTVSGVYPGSTGTVYLPVRIRTTSTSIAGMVSLNHAAIAGPTGLTSVLRYRLIRGAATCNAAAFTAGATYVVGTSTLSAAPLVSTALAATTPLAVSAGGGSELVYCFEFSLASSGLAQATYGSSSTAAMTWNVTGSS